MWKIYAKELLELTRDKKTLIFTVLLPTLVVPVIIFAFVFLSASIIKQTGQEVFSYSLIGEENFPQFAELLREQELLEYIPLEKNTTPQALVEQEKVKFVVVIPPELPQQLKQGNSLNIELVYNDASALSYEVKQRVDEVARKLQQDILRERIVRFGLTEEQANGLVNPIDTKITSTADKRESFGETLGAILPYLLLMIALSGAMYPAIDLAAGEKERGTLETLLLTPISRYKIVLAKFLVIFTTSFTAVFLSLFSFAFWLMILTQGLFFTDVTTLAEQSSAATEIAAAAETQTQTGMLDFSAININALDIFLIFVMLIPNAAIFAAILLTVSVYARTFKEAQNYMSPFMLLAIFPIILVMLPGVELNWQWATVPISNTALAIKELIKGTIDYSMLLVIFVATSIVAGLLLLFCSWWFQREQVLFRS